MTTTLVFKSSDGTSLTGAFATFRKEFADVFEDISDKLTGTYMGSALGGSGVDDLTSLSIELKNIPSAALVELRPLFSLIRKIIEMHSGGEIEGRIVTIDDNEEVEFFF